MSLRLRLTLLYSTFMGGILLIFGAAVYVLVNVILLNQVDTMLESVARDITQVTKVNSVGELSLISLPPLDMTSNAYVQVWGPDGSLIATSPSIGALSQPLDPIANAVKLARKADLVVMIAGLNSEWESEGFDRADMKLPGDQDKLIKKIAKANKNTIVVLYGATPITMNEWIDDVLNI